MIKKILLIILIIFGVFNGGATVAGDPRWEISVEQNSSSLYKKYASAPQYFVNDGLEQALTISNFTYLPKDNDRASFIKSLFSTALVLRLGRANLGFDWDYGAEHEKSSINDNIFWGYGAALNFKWNESWGTGLKIQTDYGKIDNKPISWSITRSGRVYAQKANGSWVSSTADIEMKYEQNNRVYSFGILAPISAYDITYSNTPGYPATYETTSSFSASQTFIYAGLKLPFPAGVNLLSRVEYPLGKASGLGYLVKLNYEF